MNVMVTTSKLLEPEQTDAADKAVQKRTLHLNVQVFAPEQKQRNDGKHVISESPSYKAERTAARMVAKIGRAHV